MRKILLLILVIVYTFKIDAQESQNNKNWTLGGSIALSKDNTASTYQNIDFPSSQVSFDYYIVDDTSLSGSLNPYLAKRFSNNSMIGFGLIVERSILKKSIEYDAIVAEQKTTTNTFGLNLFYRQNIFTRQKIEFFLQGKIGYLNSKVNFEANNKTEDISKSLEYRGVLDPGIAYSLTDKWNIVIIINGLKYQHLKSTEINSSFSNLDNSFSINTSLKNIHFGIEHRF